MKLLTLAAVGCTLASTGALAAGEHIVVLASDPAVQQQLTETLCVSQDCLPSGKVLTGGRPDFAKAAREGVMAVVVGRLNKTGNTCALDVSVLGRAGQTRMSRKVPADPGGKVSIIDVVSASSEVIAVIERPEGKDKPVKELKVAKVGKSKKATRVATHRKGVKVGRKVAARPASGRSRG